MSTSLKYLDYCKRRLNAFIPANTVYNFFNPINFDGDKIYQVRVSVGGVVGIYDGFKWYETQDEDLILEILVWFEAIKGKLAIQKEIDFDARKEQCLLV